MDADRRKLARRIFVTATEILEDAHEVAIAGQSPRLNVHSCLKLAQTLHQAGQDLTALADAIATLARQGSIQFASSRSRRMKPRRMPK